MALRRPGDQSVRILRPIPKAISRPFSLLIVVAWLLQMGSSFEAPTRRRWPWPPISPGMASSAHWKGIYYRGEKIGFSVGQTIARDGGYQVSEDGQLQLNLLGATSAVRLHSEARLDARFAVRDFSFSLDPGTGPTEIRGTLEGRRLSLTIKTRTGERNETRDLAEAPSLPFSFSRRLAARGLQPGETHTLSGLRPHDPPQLGDGDASAAREVVEAAGRPVPAFRVETRFSGITSTSWITDTGEVVREESPMGLIVVRETAERAQALAVPGKIQTDMLEAAAIVPADAKRIDDSLAVERLRVRLLGIESFPLDDLQGAGQTVTDGVFEVRDASSSFPALPTRTLPASWGRSRSWRATPRRSAPRPRRRWPTSAAIPGPGPSASCATSTP